MTRHTFHLCTVLTLLYGGKKRIADIDGSSASREHHHLFSRARQHTRYTHGARARAAGARRRAYRRDVARASSRERHHAALQKGEVAAARYSGAYIMKITIALCDIMPRRTLLIISEYHLHHAADARRMAARSPRVAAHGGVHREPAALYQTSRRYHVE